MCRMLRLRTVCAATSAGLLAWDHPKGASNFELKRRLAAEAIRRQMIYSGIPGLSIAVSVDGELVWQQGFGVSDVETMTPCRADTSMRIASISKPITATVAAQLVEAGRLDLDKPVQHYLPDFPAKEWNRKKVDITPRMLLTHTGGIRHYPADKNSKKNLEEPAHRKKGAQSDNEFHSNVEYATVAEAVEVFKNDPLVAEPGKKFSYTTHGYTLLSAVCEAADGQRRFTRMLDDLFCRLGMSNTTVDTNQPIVAHRTQYYERDAQHRLVNCPEVNNSIKWAGGGIASTVGDLLIFANAILYSYQHDASSPSSPLLRSQTMSEWWRDVIKCGTRTQMNLGWMRVDGGERVGGSAASPLGGYWYHTGGAVGASSVLLIRPAECNENKGNKKRDASRPRGVCVAILCNLQDTSVLSLAANIEHIFRE